MRAKEMRERSTEELKKMLLEAEGQFFEMRLKNATHQLTKTSNLRNTRREIARIKTLLKERAGTASAEALAPGDEE